MANLQKTKTEKDASFKKDLTAYFKGVRTEWGKVTWPEKRQIIFETLIVIAVVTVFTAAVYLLDLIFKGLLGLIVK